MAFDSTSADVHLPAGPEWDTQFESGSEASKPRSPRMRRRIILVAVVLAIVLATWFAASGAAADLHHVLAEAFPDLMLEGCGGG